MSNANAPTYYKKQNKFLTGCLTESCTYSVAPVLIIIFMHCNETYTFSHLVPSFVIVAKYIHRTQR